MTKTEEKKLCKLIDLLTESEVGHCEDEGGYPGDIALVGDYLVVASLDPSKEYSRATFDAYHAPKALQWYEDILDYRKENPGEELWEAINETQPTADV